MLTMGETEVMVYLLAKSSILLFPSIKETFGLDKLSVNTLLTLPNVFSTGEKDITNEEKVIFFEKLEFIVDDLIKDRIREGNNRLLRKPYDCIICNLRTLARRGLYVLFKKNNTNMYLIIIGKIVLFIGFKKGLILINS